MYPNETLKEIFEFSKMKYRILLWSVLYESHKSILADNYSSQAIFPWMHYVGDFQEWSIKDQSNKRL